MSDLTPEPGQEADRRIGSFLARLPADPAALTAVLSHMQVAEEAELAAGGVHPVSVVHGDVGSADDEKLVFGVLRGGSDYMTWFFDGAAAEQAAITFISSVTAIAPRWWVITPAAQPRFYR
jgi:hypothetical protein